ncbi:hypothetical protein EDD16DRAFT_1688394, partial [Pisolithus croceorrhizus]
MAILLCDRFLSGRSSEMTWTPNRSASSCHSSSSGRRNSRGSPASDRFETRNDPCIPRQGMVLFASVAVALQAVLAAIPDAVHLLMCSTIRVNPCDYYFLCEPAARLEFVEIFAPYDRASMEHLCAGTYFNERISGAYVLWRVRGYLISRIPSLT